MTRKYEPVQPFLFLSFIKFVEAEIIADIGANIGQYSIMSTLQPSVKKTYAFEAETAAFEELSRNIRANDRTDVVIAHYVAVSNEAGTVQFGVRAAMGGDNAIYATSIHAKTRYSDVRTVPCETLDALVSERNAIVALKIDVEGHESSVIAGATQVLTQNRCVIQVEIYDEKSSIEAQLRELGYRRLLKVGPDYYFSNIGSLFDNSIVLNVAEDALATLINYNLKG